MSLDEEASSSSSSFHQQATTTNTFVAPTATQSIYDQIIAANTSPYTIYFRQMFMSFPFLMSLLLFIYYYAHVNGMFDEVRVYMSSKLRNLTHVMRMSSVEDDDYYDEKEGDDHETNQNETKHIPLSEICKLSPSLNGTAVTKLSDNYLQAFKDDSEKKKIVEEAKLKIENTPWALSTIFFGPSAFNEMSLYRYPMFFGFSGMAQTMLARVVKGNRFSRLLGFGKLTSDNISHYYEKEGWKHEKVTISSNGQTYYFDVLQKSSSNSSDCTFSTLLLVPDIDGCLGENSYYLDSFIDHICGARNSLRLAASTRFSIHRVIIYNREGRSHNYPLTTGSNFKLLGDANALRYCIQQLAEKYTIGKVSNSQFIGDQLIGVGWGFGANLLLSTISGLSKTNYFSMCISISNPYDIKNCMTNHMTIYHNTILKQLKQIVKNNWSIFQQLPQASTLNLDFLMSSKNFIDFDTNFTLKINPEVQDIQNDYYDASSCCHHLSDDLLCPILLVSASDDPSCSVSVMNKKVTPACIYGKHENILLVKTSKGGNRAFFTGSFLPNGVAFDEKVVFDFMEAVLALSNK
ncbi:hypothetical protein FDP41_009604 [Naegleria fowleri]|uniref:Uncharacterized protein n=1 Tax=Naegleria fowleri TaxID=5763 RepID=A0A6A5BD98_NAEFO|nr:uncharacterized protein FDP41_009604 [Naegleria fowleri]KAF0971908.1 hypothetical protein FDP41_009604 [Naegleria fowleri]